MGRKARFTQDKIDIVLKRIEAGESPSALASEHNIAVSTIYMWRAKKKAPKSAAEANGHKVVPKGGPAIDELLNENSRLRKLLGDAYVTIVMSRG